MKHHSGIFVTGIFLKGKKKLFYLFRESERNPHKFKNSKFQKDKIRQIKRLGRI